MVYLISYSELKDRFGY